jgi:DNA-binding transcriptional MerR regulator
MRQTSKVEGTKIAQAAKDLNVTSVTIRRYLTEFSIETTTDENGIKVLPDIALEELKEVRRLKEEGLTNPKVMEILEERRSNQSKMGATTSAAAPTRGRGSKASAQAQAEDLEAEDDADSDAAVPEKKKSGKRGKVEAPELSAVAEDQATGEDEASTPAEGSVAIVEARAKHTLTCQTCGKAFEHMNPKLRDCLDCYRTKRKERRRGGSDKHKNVIQHPLAQQVANKTAHHQPVAAVSLTPTNGTSAGAPPLPVANPVVASVSASNPALQKGPVRNYRKAIEETRQITGSLKRRLERPDLPEGERRWLEQIYAYQLILHQGWRHLSDYKTATQQQGKED